MAHLLSGREINQIVSALSATYVIDIGDGAATLLSGALPGKAVCAIQRVDDHLFFIIDLEKPLAHRHARQMIKQWRDGYYEPMVNAVGAIELIPLDPTPEPGSRPCALSLGF